jgi:DNA-binding MarR family transcriptional regulator
MAPPRSSPDGPGPLGGAALGPFGESVGFLLSQLGFGVTRQFRAALEGLAMEPRHFALLRAIDASAAPSQQALSESLHIPASSVVALLDSLEERGLLRRRQDPSDRRVRLVELTEAGHDALARATEVAIAIESALCAGLSADERLSLIRRLQEVAGNIGLTLGVHPAGQDPGAAGACAKH